MKTILVTGSAQGLGANIIEKFAKNGYNVIITYKSSKNKAIILEDKIRKYNLNVISVKCDITKISDIRNLIKVVKSRFNKILERITDDELRTEILDEIDRRLD